MNFFVTTDMTAEFPAPFFEEDFSVVNMSYFLDGKVFDGESSPYLPFDEFYARLRSGAKSMTSMVTVEQALAFFRPLLQAEKDILHISFASALSGSYKSFLSARETLAKEFPERKFFVVDSKCAGLGEGMLVYYVLKHRREGKTIDECLNYAENLKGHINHVFTVDDIFHLLRGGRVSRGAAILGTAIQLKPVLTVDKDGNLTPLTKKIGKRVALREMAEIMQKKLAGHQNEIVMISHGNAPEDAALLSKRITEKTGIQNIYIQTAGPIIGSHVGAGMVSLFFVGAIRE